MEFQILSPNKIQKDTDKKTFQLSYLSKGNFLIKSKKLSVKNKKIFFEDLSVLLSSGIDLVNALKLLQNNFSRKKEAKMIQEFINDLIDGRSFNEVLKNSGRFSPYEYYSIRIGEETGKLNTVLTELSKYESEKLELKRKIISAFSYPTVILSTAILSVIFMLNYIVPMFEEIFLRFDKELPLLTRIIIQISDNINSYSLILIFVVTLVLILNKRLEKNEKYLIAKATFVMKIPFVGPLIKRITLSRFFLAMELLLCAKTPLVISIQLSQEMVRMQILKNALKEIEADLMNGKSLHESMKKHNLFDLRMLALIKVAEEVNKLEDIFSRIKIQLNTEINYHSSLLSSIMEPLLVIFIGLFVGLILVAMYLPIFQLSTSIM